MLEWHGHLLAQAVVPIAPSNLWNTADPLDIDYRIAERIKEHSDTVRLRQTQLDKTYSNHSQVEIAIGVCKNLGLELAGRVITTAKMMSLVPPSRYEIHPALPPCL